MCFCLSRLQLCPSLQGWLQGWGDGGGASPATNMKINTFCMADLWDTCHFAHGNTTFHRRKSRQTPLPKFSGAIPAWLFPSQFGSPVLIAQISQGFELGSSIISFKTFRTNWKCFKYFKTASNCPITTVLSRVGKRATVRVGKISLRVGSCPPLPTLSYATVWWWWWQESTSFSQWERELFKNKHDQRNPWICQ